MVVTMEAGTRMTMARVVSLQPYRPSRSHLLLIHSVPRRSRVHGSLGRSKAQVTRVVKVRELDSSLTGLLVPHQWIIMNHLLLKVEKVRRL